MAFDITPITASSAKTTTGQSGAMPCNANVLQVGVNCTAVTGTTPTLDLAVQWSFDGTNFGAAEPVTAFAQITAAKVTNARFNAVAPFYRLVWTIGGTTPSFTFSATAQTF